MRNISYILVCCSMLFCSQLWAGPRDTMAIEQVEKELLDLYIQFWDPNNNSHDHHYKMVPRFRETLEGILSDPRSFDYPFHHLSKNMKVRVSKDKRLRIFSFDDNTNPEWRKIGSIAQFLDESGRVRTQWLSVGDEQQTGEFTDVWVYGIHELGTGKDKRYMIVGEGAHGVTEHHLSIQMLYIEGAKLVRCRNCFEHAGSTLTVQAIVIDHFNLRFDEATQELSYSTFEKDESSNLYIKTGERTTLRYNGSLFKIVKRKNSN